MAWDGRDRSASSSGRRRAAMMELESGRSSQIQPWACSSLSSSEKFLSLLDKKQDDMGEKKNSEEGPLGTRYLLPEAPSSEDQQELGSLLPRTMMIIEKPGTKIVFPHITSRGSLVGKKMYCRTSIRSNITWRQMNSSRRMDSSLMILNFYNERSSSNTVDAVIQAPPTDSAKMSVQKQLDRSVEEVQCRSLFLSLAGAAGMRLICPPLQLPLLEILLFFRQRLSTKNRATALSMRGGGGVWRFPVNLGLATLRPFTGSLVRRCLTALLCLAQMRIKKNFTATERQYPRYMPADLHSVVLEKERHHLDPSKEFSSVSSTTPIQVGDWIVETAEEAANESMDRATRRNENGRQFGSNVVVGRCFEEQCCSEESWSKGVPVMKILISERMEGSPSCDNVPDVIVQQDHSTGAHARTPSEEFQFFLSDLKELKGDKVLSIKSSPRQKSGDLTTQSVQSLENGLVLSCERPHIASVDEPRNELSFTQSGFAVSQPAGQVRLDSPAVKAVALGRGILSSPDEEFEVFFVEDDSMTLTDRMSVVAGEDPTEESTSNSQTTVNLKGIIGDVLADDDRGYSSRGEERNRAVVKDIQDLTSSVTVNEKSAVTFDDQQGEILERISVTMPVEKLSLASTDVVVENQPLKYILELNFRHIVEENSVERAHQQDREVYSNEVEIINDGNCVLSERLQGRTPFQLEWNSADNRLYGKDLPAANAEMLGLKNRLLTSTGVVENEAVKETQEMPLKTLSLVWTEGVQGNKTIEESREMKSFYLAHERSSADQAILREDDMVSALEERMVGDSGTELLDRLHGDVSPSNWNCIGSELQKGLLVATPGSLPLEVPSLAATDVLENEAVKEIQGVKCIHGVQENPAERALDREIEMGNSTVPDQEGNASSQYRCRKPSLEPFTDTSSISRLNTATEAQNSNAVDHDSDSTAIVMDQLNRDQNDGHSETKAKRLNLIQKDSTRAHDENHQNSGPTETVVEASVTMSSSDDNCTSDQSICVSRDKKCFPESCPISSPAVDDSRNDECRGDPESDLELSFADHPMCVELRQCRHSHGDQTYLDMQDLLPPPWGQLIFWHGRCKEGRPTLCVMLGKAVRQLPNHELKHFIAVTVSHLEYAELNFFKGDVKQMNILMDLEGLGFMRLPPMHILSSIGAVLNRDYAGRGGWIMLVNAPVMLGFVIHAIQGVIFHNKGDLNTFKGFLEGKERIMMMGHKYRPVLQKHFDTSMLPLAFGGDCPCSSEEPCAVGNEFLKVPWNRSSHI